MVRKVPRLYDSVGRKPGTQVEVVINIVSKAGRERKLRLADQEVPDALRHVRGMLRPKGRTRRKPNRKGKGCIARRKMARLAACEQKAVMVKESKGALNQDISALALQQVS